MTRTAFLLPLLLAACDDGEALPGPGIGDDTGATGGDDTGDTGQVDTEPAYQGELPHGAYLLGFAVAPVNDLLIPFQAVATPTGDDAPRPGIAALSLAPVNGALDVGEVIGTVDDVRVAADGSFTAAFGTITLPGAYSPTGSPVDIDATLAATLAADGTFCGDLQGTILTFDIALDGSTFGTVPWESRDEGPAQSCSGGGGEDLPHIETCPTLSAGRTTDFPSGDEAREFELVLPGDYDPEQDYPLVVGWHGITRDIEQLTDELHLDAMADEAQVILAIPQARELGGTVAWDPYIPPGGNADVVLFDDLVTCISEQYSVDPDRVHTLGFSNGGLMVGTLLALRPNVLASVAPMSGGLGPDFVEGGRKTPALVVWGGESDSGSGTDFHGLAQEMVATLDERGHPLVACDHGQGHSVDPAWWPWIFRFFADHPMTEDGAPYAESGLPDVFPDFCSVP